MEITVKVGMGVTYAFCGRDDDSIYFKSIDAFDSPFKPDHLSFDPKNCLAKRVDSDRVTKTDRGSLSLSVREKNLTLPFTNSTAMKRYIKPELSSKEHCIPYFGSNGHFYIAPSLLQKCDKLFVATPEAVFMREIYPITMSSVKYCDETWIVFEEEGVIFVLKKGEKQPRKAPFPSLGSSRSSDRHIYLQEGFLFCLCKNNFEVIHLESFNTFQLSLDPSHTVMYCWVVNESKQYMRLHILSYHVHNWKASLVLRTLETTIATEKI